MPHQQTLQPRHDVLFHSPGPQPGTAHFGVEILDAFPLPGRIVGKHHITLADQQDPGPLICGRCLARLAVAGCANHGRKWALLSQRHVEICGDVKSRQRVKNQFFYPISRTLKDARNPCIQRCARLRQPADQRGHLRAQLLRRLKQSRQKEQTRHHDVPILPPRGLYRSRPGMGIDTSIRISFSRRVRMSPSHASTYLRPRSISATAISPRCGACATRRPSGSMM